jgi:hypothetical protein
MQEWRVPYRSRLPYGIRYKSVSSSPTDFMYQLLPLTIASRIRSRTNIELHVPVVAQSESSWVNRAGNFTLSDPAYGAGYHDLLRRYQNEPLDPVIQSQMRRSSGGITHGPDACPHNPRARPVRTRCHRGLFQNITSKRGNA